ncbi:Hypp2345 [Branchiostoma lanceolatum]|uniref:Hypp2345 protein n=1 Tax=Branchiostoma lanceolatum TaxID=7740 RepID=A0A8J9ZUA8_BRALA|nr:Hypp2345 [Branchiostoma lanceolatum]
MFHVKRETCDDHTPHRRGHSSRRRDRDGACPALASGRGRSLPARPPNNPPGNPLQIFEPVRLTALSTAHLKDAAYIETLS